MSNSTNDNTNLATEEAFILPILPYGLSSGNAYADTCMLFIVTIVLVYVVFIFKQSIDDTCNSTLLMLALVIYFLYNIMKYPMMHYSYELEKVRI